MARPQPSRMRTDREFRRKVMLGREMTEAKNAIERWFHERTHVDDRSEPPEVSPPARPRPLPFSRKRNPIFKGGLVTGRREGGNTA